jgi:hypothetical protein
VGESRECIAIENLLVSVCDRAREFFYRILGGTEIDFLEGPDQTLWAIEVKRSLAPKPDLGFSFGQSRPVSGAQGCRLSRRGRNPSAGRNYGDFPFRAGPGNQREEPDMKGGRISGTKRNCALEGIRQGEELPNDSQEGKMKSVDRNNRIRWK